MDEERTPEAEDHSTTPKRAEGQPLRGATSKKPQPPPEPVEPAELPRGLWRQVDYILQEPERVLESIRQDRDLWRLSRVFCLVSLVMAALYGGVMGATNLLQGSEMAFSGKVMMILAVAIKVPLLFMLSLLIVLPPVYVSNTFMGARLPFRVMQAQMLAAMSTTTIVLASMATVAFFFSLTSETYDFIKLLHVLFFAYAGLVGLVSLNKAIDKASPEEHGETPGGLFFAWLVLYGFVGTQLAWVLRPFVGAPNMDFQIFRPRTGNFYESVFESLQAFLGG